MQLVKMSAPKFLKCACCGETLRTCEPIQAVVRGENIVRGGAYCLHHDADDIRMEHDLCEDDPETPSYEREMDASAAYRYARQRIFDLGVSTETYFDDLNAGLI